MSMLSRYQKPGGFLQLLALIETCGKAKQENFLNMIEKEDPRWAAALKQKMLTIEKILSWDDNTVAEIFTRVPEITLATALHGWGDAEWERISKTFSHSHKRKIEDLKNSKNATPAEISSAFVKIIEEVRHMVKDGYIKFEKFAPELAIESEIEEKIGRSMPGTRPADAAPTETSSAEPEVPNMDGFGAPAPTGEHAAELKELRHKVHVLHHENTQLKNELKILKEKMTQIKKLSA